MRNGKENGPINLGPLYNIFEEQKAFQEKITNINLPVDDKNWSSYHMLALSEEMGELLKSDKRWKTHRNTHYDPENKLVEIADCIITLINISLYSGFSAEQVEEAILKKIKENTEKLDKGR